jgi:uncharacterized peroxidase-related enzyme
MAFIRTVPPEEATGKLKELYDQDLNSYGYVANHTRALSLRPEVLAAWRALLAAIRSNMDPRLYELATLAAAKELHSSYCMLAHASVLKNKFYSTKELTTIAKDYRNAGLESNEVALMAFAEKVTRHADQITPEDIEELRRHGFGDADILDIALAAAARNFYSKVLDAVGAEPDARYLQMQEELRQALVVGRPIEGTT